MKNINFRIPFIIIAINLITYLAAGQNSNIEGVWKKVYFEENGQQNVDSRWELIISFLSTGKFIWHSISIQEKWKVNTKTGEHSTQVIPHETRLEGNYILKNNKYHITFDRVLTVTETQQLTTNLQKNPKLKEFFAEIYF